MTYFDVITLLICAQNHPNEATVSVLDLRHFSLYIFCFGHFCFGHRAVTSRNHCIALCLSTYHPVLYLMYW